MRLINLFAALMIFGCSIKKSIAPPEKEIIYLTYEIDCGKTLSEIKKVWKNNESKLCCHYNKGLIERLKVNTNCFNDFTKEEVKGYFGIPISESKSQLSYQIHLDCTSKSIGNLKYTLHFFFMCEKQPTDKVTSYVFSKPRGHILH